MKTIDPYLLLGITIIFILLTIYLFYQLNLKKSKGKNLNKQLEDLNSELDLNTKTLENVKDELIKARSEKAHLIDLEKKRKIIERKRRKSKN